jgi:7-cyano-7-deazaguanine synthase in queuosine biosynthesis
MQKNILQSLSGGYDSTWLLIKNLMKGDNVYPLYVHAACVSPVKQTIEATVVKNLVRKLRQRFRNLHELVEIEIRMDNIRGIISLQPCLWLMGLFSEVKNQKNDVCYDEVHIGYIMTDGAISLLKEVGNLWKCLFSFSFPEYDVPKLRFPLAKYKKEIIINNLEYFDHDILESCWTCEDPRIIREKRLDNGSGKIEVYIEPCGECVPCEKIRNTFGASFDRVKKYKVAIHKKEFIKKANLRLNEIIKDTDLNLVPYKFVDLETVDNRIMEKIHKRLERKARRGR